MPRWTRALTAPFRRFGEVAKRAITSLPWSAGGPSTVTVSTANAVSLVPVFGAVRLIADNVSSLPLQLFRRDGSSREPISFVPALFWAPDAFGDLVTWLHKCVVSMALRGNAYGLITQRDPLGFPTMIEWLNPDDVWVDEYNPVKPVYYWQGREVDRSLIVHIPWVVMPGRVVGLSPVAAFAHTIGAGLAVTEYGRSWFRNGGTPPAVLKNGSKAINPDEAEEISDRLSSRIRARKPLVIGSDWDFTALSVSPEESQFVESMRLNATQIAVIYGVPPEKVGGESGGSLTYSTVELNSLDLVNTTLRPWLVRLESTFSRLMPGREYVRFNIDAMMRTSTLDRYNAHGMSLAQGWRNRDEVRALENLSPLPPGQGGDIYGALPAAPAPPAATAENQED
ncbi:phage portal protein [Streptomyces sp. NPDC008121]|uniref:phage portal protein n=1 Tax=Streptomyces sp. NPDC008121 TaxID=3364809 RepID=UPI0036E55923